jgi:hypothetical protein
MPFVNTYRFRVNANGNRLDIWLIYQCEKCKHTINLTIYERKNPKQIPDDEYSKFLDNNYSLAKDYGMKVPFFQKNKVEILWEEVQITYKEAFKGEAVDKVDLKGKALNKGFPKEEAVDEETLEDKTSKTDDISHIPKYHFGDTIILTNPYQVKIRPEKHLADLLGCSRSQVKKMIKGGTVEVITIDGKVTIRLK